MQGHKWKGSDCVMPYNQNLSRLFPYIFRAIISTNERPVIAAISE